VIITEYNKLLKTAGPSKARPEEPRENRAVNSSGQLTPAAVSRRTLTPEEEAEEAMYGVSSGSEADAAAGAHPGSSLNADPSELAEPLDVLMQCEQAVLRLLVLYGPHEVQPEVTVAHYLLSQLDGTPLRTPLYARLWGECREQFLQGQLPDLRRLAHHEDAAIRSLLADFATERYDLSPNWRIKDIYVPTELNLIQLACDNAILRLNKCHVQRERQQCLAQLNDSRLDENEQLNAFLRYNELTKLDNQLAQLLGTVVARNA
jgi:DNA primase